MASEDEAIALVMKIGEAGIGSAEKLIELLFNTINAARGYRNGYYGPREDGIIKKGVKAGAHAAKEAAGDAISERVAGVGSSGIVSTRKLRRMANATGDSLQQFALDEKMLPEEINTLNRECAKRGLAMAQTVNPDGAVSLIMRAKDFDLAADTLVHVGIAQFGMSSEAFKGAGAIKRDDEGGIPDRFDLRGYSFERDDDGAWKAPVVEDGKPTREVIEVSVGRGGDDASWRITKNGETLREGRVAPMGEGDLGRDASGEVVLAVDGKPANFVVGGSISRPSDEARSFGGHGIESAVQAADYALSVSRHPSEPIRSMAANVQATEAVRKNPTAGATGTERRREAPASNYKRAEEAAARTARTANRRGPNEAQSQAKGAHR